MIGNKTVVYTSGTFDMLHVNHLKMLEYARSLGDILIVGVNTDELVASIAPVPDIVKNKISDLSCLQPIREDKRFALDFINSEKSVALKYG